MKACRNLQKGRWRSRLGLAARLALAGSTAVVMGWGESGITRLAAQESGASMELVEQYLAAGEFAAARRLASELPAAEGDRARVAIAGSLAGNGLRRAAVNELGGVSNPQFARSAMSDMFGLGTYGGQRAGKFSESYSGGYPGQNSGVGGAGVGDATGGGVLGGAGGAALADFSSLMELIQTTIAPDQWEALGGPSTMFPYPAGIYVDPDGLVRDIQVDRSDRLASLNALAGRDDDHQPDSIRDNADWTQPAKLRVVSLRKLRDAYMRTVADATTPSVAMQNLAGLSDVRYVIVEDDDILLAGAVGGIDPAAAPWPRDRRSGRTTLGLDLLVASANSVRNAAPYGCTIDPTAEGLAAATQVSAKISSRDIPTATATDALAEALGPQKITLFDIPGDQPLAWLLVDADRHMKQLALGKHPMPHGVMNYLDVVEQATRQNAGQGVPNGQLLRMWFAVQPKEIRQASNALTFELEGQPIRLITAKEFADGQGGRIRAGADPLGQTFAENFNRHFDSIAAEYPLYDRLRGAFELTAAMQLVKTQVDLKTFDRLVGELASPDLMFDGSVAVPTHCDSLAVRHTIRTKTKRHEVYIVSGGIKIDPAESLVSKITPYPVLDSLDIDSSDAPIYNTRWWWDR